LNPNYFANLLESIPIEEETEDLDQDLHQF